MHFLAPLWLGALAALALPLVLHLLSRGRGRRVPLASTRLLESALSVRGRRLKPSDLALLLLRCAILAAVALALAEPWVDAAPSAAAGSWLLVEPRLEGGSSSPAGQPRSNGDETLARWQREASVKRYLAPGLPESDPGPEAAAPDVWSLLAEADRLAPAGAELRVATRGRLAELRGRRPSLVHRVLWVEVDGKPGQEQVLVAAGPAEGTAVAAVLERGGREVVAVEHPTVSVGGSAGALSAAATGEKLRVTDAGGRALELVPSGPVPVALHADGAHATSAAIWRRACDVGAAALGARLTWGAIPAGTALRLWLDDGPPPGAWGDGGLLVTEARSPGAPCNERVAADSESVLVERCEEAAAGDLAAPAEWLSGSGRGLLFDRQGAQRAHLATRVDPAWSGLAQSSALPRQCARWLERELVARQALALLPAADPRAAAEAQRSPGILPAPAGAPSAERREASAAFWLAAAALLAFERLLSARSAPAVQTAADAVKTIR